MSAAPRSGADLPVAGARGRPRSEKARIAVLKAMQRLLAQADLRDISIEAIAREAGVGKATIYRWWPGKTAIAIDAFDERMRVLPADPAGRGADALARIQRNQALVARQYAGPTGRLVSQILAEVQSDPAARRAFIERVFTPRRAVMRDLLLRGQAGNELTRPADADAVIDLLYGAIYLRLMVGHRPLDAAFTHALQAMAEALLSTATTGRDAGPAGAKAGSAGNPPLLGR